MQTLNPKLFEKAH